MVNDDYYCPMSVLRRYNGLKIAELENQIEDLAEALMSAMEEIERQKKVLEWALDALYEDEDGYL